MLIAEHISALRREGERFADAVGQSDLDGAVVTCPQWTVRELAHHVGRVHRWAATVVRESRTRAMDPDDEEAAWGSLPADGALDAWLRDGHGLLVDVLTNASPDLDCWTFLDALSPLAFWARRQAHETAIHRADAQTAIGQPDPVSIGFAVDGLDELLLCFFSGRSRRLRSERPVTLAVSAIDADASWLVRIGPDGQRSHRIAAAEAGAAQCTLRGPASELYLALWNRRPATDLLIGGDPTVIDLWRDRAWVRWS